MSYRSKPKRNYGNQRRRVFGRRSKKFFGDTEKARENFESRSKRSQVQDLIRMAPLAPDIDTYLRLPNKFDFPNIDTPDPHLIFSHRNPNQQAQDLARLASKAPLEIWIRNVAAHDIQNVDTPSPKKQVGQTRKFKVTRKEFEAEELAKAEKAKKEKKARGRKLPSKEEILEKAKEIAMMDQLKQGIEPITPEESELKEAGIFEEARAELMRGEDSVLDSQVQMYISQIKQELSELGYTVVPLSEVEM